MPQNIIQPLTGTSITFEDEYADFSVSALADAGNQNKILLNIVGNLTCLSFGEFIDLLLPHLAVLKELSFTNAAVGSFLRKGATGSLAWTGLIDTSVFLVGFYSYVCSSIFWDGCRSFGYFQ